MNKAYSPINWENYPSTNSPINEQNLNKLSNGVSLIDDRVIALDTTKAGMTDIMDNITNIALNSQTGVFTVTRKDGSSFTIDTLLEKVAVNFGFDENTQSIVIYLEDGTTKTISLSAFVTQYEFTDSPTIGFTSSGGNVSASVKDGSITDAKLNSSVMANLNVAVANAQQSALAAAQSAQSSAQSASESEQSASASALSAAQSESNAGLSETYALRAESAVETVNQKLQLATFSVNANGELVYTDNTSYVFTVNNGTGNLEYALA